MSNFRFRYKDENGKWSDWFNEDQLEELKGKYVLAESKHLGGVSYEESLIRTLETLGLISEVSRIFYCGLLRVGRSTGSLHTEELMKREDAMKYLKRFSDDS